MLNTIGTFLLNVLVGATFWGVIGGVFYLLNKLLGDKIFLVVMIVIMAAMSGSALVEIIKLLNK